MRTPQNGPVRPPMKPAAAPMPIGSVRNKADDAAQPGEWRDPAVFGPLDGRIRQEERQEKEARKRKPRAATRARSGGTGSRRKSSARANKPERPESEAFLLGKEIAIAAAQRIRAELGDRLSRDESVKLTKSFRSAVVPRRKPGRQPSTRVTAAYSDWKAGMRPGELCEKHIPGWRKHNRYRRNGEMKALMDAIRTRRRRDAARAA
jgi:hypothetical protein